MRVLGTCDQSRVEGRTLDRTEMTMFQEIFFLHLRFVSYPRFKNNVHLGAKGGTE